MDVETRKDYLKLQSLILKIRDLLNEYIDDHSGEDNENEPE
jgi:hypothetical protein